jgi:predicted nucleic acid-binding Zn ribbon protein
MVKRRRTDNTMVKRRRTDNTMVTIVLSVLFLLTIVLSVLLWYTDSDCPFGIFKLFLSFCPFSFGHCVVCSSSSLKIPKGQSESVYRKRTDNTMTERKRTKGQEEFEDTKGVIRIRISKKNRQHNGRKKKDKRTRRVWRCQRGNQNTYIEEEQTTQCSYFAAPPDESNPHVYDGISPIYDLLDEDDHHEYEKANSKITDVHGYECLNHHTDAISSWYWTAVKHYIVKTYICI